RGAERSFAVNAFLSYVIHGLAVGCSFALLASGIIIIYRVTRVVNLAQGSFAVIAAFTAAALLAAGLPHGVAELVATLTAAAVGLVAGWVAIAKHGTSPQASLIATLGLAIFGYAVEILIWGDQPRGFSGLEGSFELAGVDFPKQYALVAVVTLTVFGLLEVFFERTYLGKALSACASNPYAAKLVGISVVRMGLVGFALGGALGGIAGVLVTPLSPLSYDSDVSLFVSGFASAIVAGLKRPLLALGGGLFLGVAESLIAGYAKASYQSAVALLLTLAILVVQGLLRPTLHTADE
ncbi:MAG TPA: branched-chain amino acid ABC transporter permease, partial [Polyangiaceae bacterium]|nr:branched-chain amino acid ABC transporter permease [Polyangiaceae bacterium]